VGGVFSAPFTVFFEVELLLNPLDILVGVVVYMLARGTAQFYEVRLWHRI
jgi:hypothetical protein